MIAQQSIEQVAAASDIVEVIGGYVPLKRAGGAWKARCPFHQEKSPSFTVNPSRQTFKCFGCGAAGGVFKFVTLFTNIDFPSAVRMLAERAHIAIEEDTQQTEADRGMGQVRRRLLRLHADAAVWLHRNLMKSPAAAHARAYLKARGLSGEVAVRWRLGYAPESWDALKGWAEAAGYQPGELLQSGLVTARDDDPSASYDRFRDRLMFPICNEVGEVVGFSGRVLQPDAKGGKYVNSPESPIFTKGKVLFGLHLTKRAVLAEKSAIVCEGQLDLITAFEAGILNVIAPQGTAFTEQQARLLKRHADEAVLCFDADDAGQAAAEKSLAALLDANVTVRVATMPPGQDPDSLIRSQGAEAFKARIAEARDFFDFQIDRLAGTFDLSTPRGKAHFSAKIAESVALVTEVVLREAVVSKVSARLGLSPDTFRALLRRKPAPRPAGAPQADLLAAGAPAAPKAPEAASDAATAFEQPGPEVVALLKVALESPDARDWLNEQAWEDVLPHVAGSDLLVRVLNAGDALAETQAMNAFLSTLSPEAEGFLTGLLMDRPFPQPVAVAQGWWRGLEKKLVEEWAAAVEAKLRIPGISPEETARLLGEFLALKKRAK